VTVCAKLHNFCIDANIPIYENRFYRAETDRLEVLLNGNNGIAEAEAHRDYSCVRNQITQFLEDQGVVRPALAMMNSPA
jgi:hypothetical protein